MLGESIPKALGGRVASVGIVRGVPVARARIALDKAAVEAVVSNFRDDTQDNARLVTLGVGGNVLAKLGLDEDMEVFVSVMHKWE